VIVLGLSGGADLAHENRFGLTPYQAHDAACVLLEDGEVVFAIEEERLDRIKHSNKFPHKAIARCLASRGIAIGDVDRIAFYHSREAVDVWAKRLYLERPQATILHDAASLLRHLIERGGHGAVDESRLRFVHHHQAHAMSAYALSGFEEALVVSLDGEGDGLAGVVLVGRPDGLTPIASLPVARSLGLFYAEAIAHLGYRPFEEYKVMGLAPYGDPGRYRQAFRSLYRLLPEGGYEIDRDGLLGLFALAPPRRKGAPFTAEHKDIAAALQEALEELAFHLLRHYREATGQRDLCLAGGVAHNCALNGKLLRSGLFDRIFVQPAAHDAGCALGAALCADLEGRAGRRRAAGLAHVFWGAEAGTAEAIADQLAAWGDFLLFGREEQICRRAAELLAGGEVLGWVQGRSEFGPRALGARSILADPRPPANKERINAMVKKREGYRPFAPSVLEEHAGEYFALPPGLPRLPFMAFVVEVREEQRSRLGAVTHVDGTARIQTVSREAQPRFWSLIDEFRQISGVPMVLNTSFNNDVEPIVDSVEDAVVCFLTTDLDGLVVGDWLVRKRPFPKASYLRLRPSLPAHLSSCRVTRTPPAETPSTERYLASSHDLDFRQPLSEEAWRLLAIADGRRALGDLLPECGLGADETARQAVLDELLHLWSRRLVALRP
jgi:carbamoyltransferase